MARRRAPAPSVGANVPRREGPDKLTGRARYLDDLPTDALHGVTLRSSIARGYVTKIRFDPAFPWSECVIARAEDIPGENVVALIEKDQPLLSETEIRHPMEPILLLAHKDRATAYEALKHIQVDYETLPGVFTIEESLEADQLLVPPDNVFKSFSVEKGDIEAGFQAAHLIVEGEYRVPHQEQAYIENNAVLAYDDQDGVLTVVGSIQCPYYVHKALKALFPRPDEKLRVIQSVTGGGFGGKEEYPNILAGHAALLALKAGRPVKMVYDRHEDMAATTKRHPARVRHKTAVAQDGRLLAQDIEVVMDGGAYATLSSVVLSRGTLHAAGPYACPNVRILSKVVATNSPPNGAFRGFGAPQTLFAAELHMEKIAQALGVDALALRRKNVLKPGSTTATGQVLKESVGATEVLEKAVKKSGYLKKRKEYARWNENPKRPTWKGIGLALVHHGAGFTGSGEAYLASRASVTLTREGLVRVDAASTEIGQGTNTIFAQIAADAIGLPYEAVQVAVPDTAKVPNSGPTVASRTCMVVGGLVHKAALELKEAVEKAGGHFKSPKTLAKAAAILCAGKAETVFLQTYRQPEDIRWDDKSYKGDAYGVYSYACMVTDLEVDKLTCEVKVNKVTAAQDIGTTIHPLLAEGQVIGGLVQGLGYALLENPVYKEGLMQNANFTNYTIPTALDAPPFAIDFVEKPYSRGPFGAKGVGELPMDVPGPSVAAALGQALGVLLCELPLTPERISQALL